MKVEVISQQFDTFYTFGNLISVLRIFSLSCLYRDGMKLKASWSNFKIITLFLSLTSLNIISIIFKVKLSNIEFSLSFRSFVLLIFLVGYFQYGIDLYFVYKYGRDICLEYIRIYDHIDRVLYFTYYSAVKRSIFKLFLFFTILIVFSYVFDFIVWGFSEGWLNSTLYGVNYFYSYLRALVAVDMLANIIQLEYRLKIMADVLEDFYSSSSSLHEVVLEHISKPKWTKQKLTVKRSNRLDFLKTISINREYSVPMFARCYLLLLEQAEYFNNMYGFRILIMCISLLVDIIITINLAVRLIAGTMVPSRKISEYYTTISTFVRLATQTSVVLCGVYRAEKTNKELRRIVRVSDLLLVNKIIPEKTRESLKGLRDLVISRPIQFHAVHFFTVNYRFLVSITSVIVTYTILLLQYMK